MRTKWYVLSLMLAAACAALMNVTAVVAQDKTADKAADKGKTIELLKGASLDDFEFFLDEGAKKTDVYSLGADGVLKVAGKPFGWLGTKKLYHNFEVCGEFRYPDKTNMVNSGLFLRVCKSTPTFLPKCVEVQLAPKSLGDLYGFWNMKITGDQERSRLVENHKVVEVLRSVKHFRNEKKDDMTQWNKVHVVCFEDLIVVRMNGKIVNWATGLENVPGRIAFQSEGAPVEFRNFTVKVLD
ncbi:MAG: DUF1080 domain-containing protein [Planctomycetia bacterium]|nr:DUF1080 domain-containing protein [Planctomycetia bacterium]